MLSACTPAKPSASCSPEVPMPKLPRVAALTVYDMTKALDKSTVISDLRLDSKTGGKSGKYKR